MSEEFKAAWDKYVESIHDTPDLESLYTQGWKDFQKEAVRILEKYDSRDWLNFIRNL